MILSGPALPVVVIQDGRRHWRFTGLVEVVEAQGPEQVESAVARIEASVAERGLFAAGYLTYEAATAFGLPAHRQSVRALPASVPPLLWFGLFGGRELVGELVSGGDFRFGEWTPSISEADYCAAVEVVKEAIAAGNTYQANLTFNLSAAFDGDPWALYVALCRAQQANYTAFLDLGHTIICSASPELFFRRNGQDLVAKPMKGTAQRGLSAAEDQAQIAWLHNSEKNRAENVMIVDMIRNDFGRVAKVGRVRVPELFAIERYPTLLQMTSTVTAETDASLSELLSAAFPCASITGAPKVRTMQLLHDLEPEPRGIYTGSIGYLTPDGRSQFNVAIRTVVIDRDSAAARYGVGSGIVWDSEPAAEYAECLLKARVLEPSSGIPVDFALLESLRWTPTNGYWLLEPHLDRLVGSAEYFGVPVDRDRVANELARHADTLSDPSKVRLLLGQESGLRLTDVPLSAGQPPTPVRLGLAREPVSSTDRWLYHKTSVRTVYEQARAGRPDCDDVILHNERGEVTETSSANIVVALGGVLYTPPISSGLLAGTARRTWLERGELIERVITVDDLAAADRLWVLNSVRGLLPAVLV